MTRQFTLLPTLRPRIRSQNGWLVASTSWFQWSLLLGSYHRQLVIDPRQRQMIFRRRSFWFFKRVRLLRFEEIESVTYGYDDWALTPAWEGSHSPLDAFTAGLRLRDGEELRLFTFVGKGSLVFDSAWSDLWDGEIDWLNPSGSQEGDSRLFVELLAKLIGVKISRPT